jgi:hypothetical protein
MLSGSSNERAGFEHHEETCQETSLTCGSTHTGARNPAIEGTPEAETEAREENKVIKCRARLKDWKTIEIENSKPSEILLSSSMAGR